MRGYVATVSDDHIEEPEFDYFADFQDPIAQRAVAFCNLAQIAESANDAEVKELCLAMMRKVSATVRTLPNAELKSVSRPHPDT